MRTFIVSALVLCSSIVTLNAAEKTVVGTVKAVDAANNSITVDDVELDVTRKSQISVDGRKAGLEDVKTGQPARVTYDDSLEVAITIVVGEGSDDDEATSKDMKAIQGEWKCVAGEENGTSQDKSIVKKQNRRVTVKGNSLTLARTGFGDKYGAYIGKFEIDASNGQFDWIGKGPGGNLIEWIGIYELDGDELKLCYIYQKDDEAKRPTEFKSLPPSKPGMAHVFFTFKRDND
jgi:uncharacterized protein (TIGR03067 family)